MYNVKGPGKIAAKTARRGMHNNCKKFPLLISIFLGIAQNRETFRDHNKSKSVEGDENEVIRSVFSDVYEV